MKLIIDIDNDVYNRIKNGYPEPNDCYKCQDDVLYGKPYEEKPQGDLISREALIIKLDAELMDISDYLNIHEQIKDIINNLPAINTRGGFENERGSNQ